MVTQLQEIIKTNYHIDIHAEKKMPSITNLAKRHGVRTPTMFEHIEVLKKKGLINFKYCPECGSTLLKEQENT